MKRIIYFVLLAILLIPGSAVFASDISNAQYTGVIRVSNNGTAVSNVAVNITGINTTSLINDGFLAATADDCVIQHSGSDISFMPGYATNPWMLYVGAINENSYYNDILYTPEVTTPKIRYFPGSNGLVTSDNVTVELSDNFTFTLSGFINTTSGNNKNLIYKQDAFIARVDNTTSGKVNVLIPLDTELLPNAPGDACGIASQAGSACPNHYLNVDESYTAPSSAEHNWTTNAAEQIDYYNTENGTFHSNMQVYSVTVFYTVTDAGGTGYAKPYLRLAGNNTAGTEINSPAAWTTYNQTLSRPGGGNWQSSDIEDLQVGIGLRATAGTSYVSQISIFVECGLEVSLSSINSGEYIFEASANTTHLTIDISGSSNSTSLYGNSIPDNSNDLFTCMNNSITYLEYQDIEIDGVQAQHIEWEYGASFTDSSVNSNDATPSFRTTSSDADVSAELISFTPLSESTAPPYSVADSTPWISSTPTVTGDFSVNVTSTLPGSEVIGAAAEAGETPVQMPFVILGSVGLLGVSWLASYFTRKSNSSSVIPKLLIVVAAMGLLTGVDVYDFWMLTYFFMMAGAFAMAKTHTTWGGEGGYNVIGFLAMAFVGMTVVNRIMEGSFITSTDVEVINNVLVFRPVDVFGLFSISVPNMSFLTEGLPHLVTWDYGFFGGNAVLIKYLFYSITAFVSFLLFIVMLGMVANMLSRSR